MTIESSRQGLVDWLMASAQNAEHAIAQSFGFDAATIALYAEEMRESIERMVLYVNDLAQKVVAEQSHR
jgi:hypothetical protein